MREHLADSLGNRTFEARTASQLMTYRQTRYRTTNRVRSSDKESVGMNLICRDSKGLSGKCLYDPSATHTKRAVPARLRLGRGAFGIDTPDDEKRLLERKAPV